MIYREGDPTTHDPAQQIVYGDEALVNCMRSAAVDPPPTPEPSVEPDVISRPSVSADQVDRGTLPPCRPEPWEYPFPVGGASPTVFAEVSAIEGDAVAEVISPGTDGYVERAPVEVIPRPSVFVCRDDPRRRRVKRWKDLELLVSQVDARLVALEDLHQSMYFQLVELRELYGLTGHSRPTNAT